MSTAVRKFFIVLSGAFTLFFWGTAAQGEGQQDAAMQERNRQKIYYNVRIASHDFDFLEKYARQVEGDYLAGKIDGDGLADRLMLLTADNDAIIPDDVLWTQQKPDSYAAHYVLAQQYLEQAIRMRGGKFISETPREQIENMHKSMELARSELEKSIKLFAKPYPSYRTLIVVDGYVGSRKPYRSLWQQFSYFAKHGRPEPVPPAPDGYAYLQAAAQIEKEPFMAYSRYIEYHNRRWGGDYDELERLVNEARQNGMSAPHVARLESDIQVWKARDELTFNKDPARAVDYWLAAYRACPNEESVGHLHAAASDAKTAGQFDRAIEIYSMIIKEFKDDSSGYFNRGAVYYEKKQDYPRAFADFMTAAKMGNMYAQNNVGYFYMTGRLGKKDLVLARHYFTLAAAQGFEHSKEKLKMLDAMEAQTPIAEKQVQPAAAKTAAAPKTQR
jgi:tetratricopeptide (TPR) repeat protein